jgi:transcriptional regulator with GAF, ATPase, and Fis domain
MDPGVAKPGPRHSRDESTVAALPRERKTRSLGAVLRPVDAPGDPTELRLRAAPCRVGAGRDNDLVINHRTVSRAHAEFSLDPEGVKITDLDSRNGTFYLGNRIGTMVLGLGARVQLGAVTLAIEPDTEELLTGLEYEREHYRGVLGRSPRARTLFALLERLESSTATVLIEGESGVGKEVVARALHDGSSVADKRFVVLNCGAIPRDLVASELFGHRRGAFTGATEPRLGAFDQADGGTLFLDEIGELPLEVQPTLLRAIEAGEIRPLGAQDAHRAKVRILAATNRDLYAEVGAGRFREDLFYRLAVVRVQVPPLRARLEDVDLLANYFAASIGHGPLPAPVLEQLRSRSWPGNARELRNAIQSYAAVGQLPPAIEPPRAAGFVNDAEIDPTIPYPEQKERVVEQFTRAYLKALLRYTNGHQSAAARIGKLDRTTLGRLMTKYGLHVRKVD